MIPSNRPRRSALFLPASNARALEKAKGLPCDVVILDLEDAVAPEAKAEARAAAVAAVKAGGFGARELVVRVNGLDTDWGAADLEALREAGADAVLVPKIAGPEDIDRHSTLLGGETALWVMIETARAIGTLQAIADRAAETRLAGLVVGPNDLALEMRARRVAGRATLLPLLALTVAAGRSAGLAVLDGVRNDFTDLDAFAAECEQGRDLGFDGKTLIHPAQVVPANAAFSPSEAERAWAAAVIAAFEQPDNAAKGAIRVEGKMVERLHLIEAQRVAAMPAAE